VRESGAVTGGQPSGPDAAERGDAGSRRPRRGLVLGLGGIAALGVLSAPIGWMVTDRLERDDDFCNACHLASGTPLHREIRRGFDARPPVSLAGAHGAARVDDAPGPKRAFRCIDCHGGVGWLGRARVKALAAKDAFWYVVGHFEEPDSMRWPLRDADCTRCHERFDEAEAPAWRSPRFHQLAVHNADLGVGCVECHLVHEPGGDADAHFLHATHVRTQCARCHPEFEDDPSADHLEGAR
jgi:hypothetical protein